MPEYNEKDRLLDHAYDGIQEYDNPMPRWWVTSFVATIIFAVVYGLNIGGIGVGAGRIADYEKDMAAFRLAYPLGSANVAPDVLMAVANDPAQVAAGKAIFLKNCAPCHLADGGGFIGPNLTDDYWIHGGRIEQIHATIFNGVLAKGMPTWSKLLRPDDIQRVTAYVWSLHGTTPAKPKAPQGNLQPR
jgi:cytochrome c oxidase cbb3-type subunit 3